MNKGKSILILDNDHKFRELVCRLLKPLGYPIIERTNVAEALAITPNKLLFAIVDFALPDANGGSFVSRLREEGSDLPIVFVSTVALDQQSFGWLRNILKVSLVLQKPIDPALFVQQIEGLLPQEDRPLAQPAGDITKQDYPHLLHASAGAPPSGARVQPPQEILDSGTWKAVRADPQYLQQVQEMHAKVSSENSIKSAQKELAKELPHDWETLSKRLLTLRHNVEDTYTKDLALSLAEKVREQSGSLGMPRVAAAAGKVEDYVKLLDPKDLLSQDILWMEIFRALADGESELRTVLQPDEDDEDADPINAGEVLMLAGENTLHRETFHGKLKVDAKVTFFTAPLKVATSAAAMRFDAAVLDISCFGKAAVFALARELRGTDLNESLPLAFVLSPDTRLSDSERVFYGASEVVTAPLDIAKFESCLRKLAGVNELKKVRILAVDDDPVLTRFLQTVLSVHGMTVSTLSDAIQIIDTVEKVQPDIILLDVVMPGLSGYDICRMLRANERWCDVPIIFLTSKSDAQGRAAAFQAGANDFLSKPVLTEELIARVQMQLQRAQFGRQRASADKVTGLFTQEAFLDRAADMQSLSEESRSSMSITLLQIEGFDDLERYGLFSSITVLSQVGNLLKCRLPSETLRGRFGEAGFALAYQSEEAQTVKDVATLLSREIEQISFAGDKGVSFHVHVKTASATYPQDALSFKALWDTVQGRLKQVGAGRA